MSNRTVQIQLAEGETRLLDYKDELVVTDRRIRHARNDMSGQLSVVSMMIDDLRSAEFGRRSHPALLGISSVLFGIGGYAGEEVFLMLAILSAALIGAYFLTKKVVLELKSTTAAITIDMNRSKVEDAYDFIDKLEIIRHERLITTSIRRTLAA